MGSAQPRTARAVTGRTLGRSLALTELAPGSLLGMDLTWASGSHGRDLAWVSGGDTLAQALEVALLTALGSDVFNTRFGFDGLRALADLGTSRMAADVLHAELVRTLARESRIRQVLRVEPVLVDPQTRCWRVDVEVQTILGDVLRAVFHQGELHG